MVCLLRGSGHRGGLERVSGVGDGDAMGCVVPWFGSSAGRAQVVLKADEEGLTRDVDGRSRARRRGRRMFMVAGDVEGGEMVEMSMEKEGEVGSCHKSWQRRRSIVVKAEPVQATP